MRSNGLLFALSLAACTGLAAGPARGQSPDETRGRELFEQGQKAMAVQDYATACPRFQESYNLGGVAGSLLNWADCEEARGRLATALELWQQGEAKVVRDPERLDFVTKRIAALTPRVPRIEVTAADSHAEQVRVELDGTVIDITRGPLPVNPGKHTLHATASGSPPEDQAFEVAPAESKKLTLRIRAKSAPAATSVATAAQTATPPAAGPPALAIAGWTLGAMGAAGLIGFAVTGGMVLSSCQGSLNPCRGDRGEIEGLNVANAALLGVGLGGVASGVGLLLLHASKPRSEPQKPAAGATASRKGLLLHASDRGALVGVTLSF